jgi:hypothetical protein
MQRKGMVKGFPECGLEINFCEHCITIKFERFCDEVETNFRRHRVIFATKIKKKFFRRNSFVGLATTHGSSSV